MKAINLHSGGYEVSLDELAMLPVSAPTETYFPIPHIDLVEMVKNSLFRTGYSITDETHAVAGERYFGLMDLKSDYADRTTTLGLRNSHDQKFPAGMVVGNRVFVCSNLAFNGEVKFSRRHTTHIMRDLPRLIDSSIGKINDFETSQAARIEAYKTTELDIKDVDHALMSILRAKILPANTVVKALEEFNHPRHDEFKKDGNTVWRIYNATTEFLKSSLWLLPRRTFALHAILDKFVKLPIEGKLVNMDLFPV
jgi:hypothetical protein